MSLARTATAAPPRQAKRGQISSFHLHQVLTFQKQGHRMTGEPHHGVDVLLAGDDPGDALMDTQIALSGAVLPTSPHAAAGAHIGGYSRVLR
jgi:hypothetical protein